MAKKATSSDAELILKLYDLRREAEMRKARAWWATSFFPQSAEDVAKIANSGTQENAWYRQVLGYWDMAASLVLHGALNEQLFFETHNEMWFVLSKMYPVLKEHRKLNNAPHALEHIEKLATRTKQGRERLAGLVKFVAGWRQALVAAGKLS